MQILVVSSTYPSPTRPRQGAFNQVMVDALRGDHQVAVISPVPWTQLNWRAIGHDLLRVKSPVDDQEGGTLYPVSYYPPKILRNQYHHFYWRSMRRCLTRLPSGFRPDVVLGYWLHPDGDAAVRAARYFRVPAVVMSGGTDLRILTKDAGRRKEIKRVIDESDRLIVVSHELGHQAERIGILTSKIEVIYRGVDCDCFAPADRMKARHQCGLSANDIVLVWAGRLEAVKNPRMLVCAAGPWVQKWGSRLRVIVVGDGSLRTILEQECFKRGLSEYFRFEGNLSQESLAVRFQAADATLLTSHSEGIPNVLLESIACGTPFVATDVGGVREIATSEIDFLVNDNDADGLSQSAMELVSRGISHRTRGFVPSTCDEMAERLEMVLSRVVERDQDAITTPVNGLRNVGRRAS